MTEVTTPLALSASFLLRRTVRTEDGHWMGERHREGKTGKRNRREKLSTEGRLTRQRREEENGKGKGEEDLGHRVTSSCFMHIIAFKIHTTFLAH